MHPEARRPARSRRQASPRYDRDTRKQLARIDTATIQMMTARANVQIGEDNLSGALDSLTEAKKAVDRAYKMIQEGR